MMNPADPTMPRYQLPFEQLPRGFVPWPRRITEALEEAEHSKGFRFADEYRASTLERQTLRYYYEDLHVAYRPADGGIEVLAVGWPEAFPYLKDPTVKVVQA